MPRHSRQCDRGRCDRLAGTKDDVPSSEVETSDPHVTPLRWRVTQNGKSLSVKLSVFLHEDPVGALWKRRTRRDPDRLTTSESASKRSACPAGTYDLPGSAALNGKTVHSRNVDRRL